ncbi:fluoride efflux transporter CrcB [Hymenobacter sp. BT683]|uniref:Fluoride-specific ion channel FluC n=1 Tax=Hymenobacter jeongseonensis TaxID=2791027 RepID=A0ABS0IIE6_9BACT|nr:fluoride efflux transporter CrcB [Hymenobacter jeongseonensis]MBF9238120.1 fluoride efflux transporter CrcB [Hymenobacter jeongseonensis]
MNYSWLLIGAGGGLGAIARYLMQQYVQGRWPLAWPVGTGAVNALGCLLAGLFLGLLERHELGQAWRLLLITGVCGGFTTFSAFALENVGLLRAGHVGLAALYAGGSVAVGVLVAGAGYWLARG